MNAKINHKEDYDRHEYICSFAPPGILDSQKSSMIKQSGIFPESPTSSNRQNGNGPQKEFKIAAFGIEQNDESYVYKELEIEQANQTEENPPQQGSNSQELSQFKIEQDEEEFFKPINLEKRKTIMRKNSL